MDIDAFLILSRSTSEMRNTGKNNLKIHFSEIDLDGSDNVKNNLKIT